MRTLCLLILLWFFLNDEQHLWDCAAAVFSPGLGLLVTWLSDPDNLNQLVVSQLDSVSPKGSVEELSGSDLDQTSLASQEGQCEGSEA